MTDETAQILRNISDRLSVLAKAQTVEADKHGQDLMLLQTFHRSTAMALTLTSQAIIQEITATP